jgi:carbon-monoxide dehydrogenase small subunit
VKTTHTRFQLNGKTVEVDLPDGATLLEALRRELFSTGTKEGCGEGECGACTVLVEGEPVASCLMLVAQVHDKEVLTVEGLLRDNEALHPIQDAFIAEAGTQCGFCTPGFLVAVQALLQKNHNPTDAEILEALQGNLCRCTGYGTILASVRRAAAILRGEVEHSGAMARG